MFPGAGIRKRKLIIDNTIQCRTKHIDIPEANSYGHNDTGLCLANCLPLGNSMVTIVVIILHILLSIHQLTIHVSTCSLALYPCNLEEFA